VTSELIHQGGEVEQPRLDAGPLPHVGPLGDGQYVSVKTLAPTLRDALASVRYGAQDIRVIPAHAIEARAGGASAGSRGFVQVVNLDTGASHVEHGDWGGAGLGRRLADWTEDAIPIPANGAVVKGTTGYPRTFAQVYVHPDSLGRFLPEATEQLSEAAQQVLYCFGSIKGGQYRRDELRRRVGSPAISDPIVDSLVERGYLKRNKAGAVQITTRGKNARTIRH
jgi:hypothetical protein